MTLPYINPLPNDWRVTSPQGDRVHPVNGGIKPHKGIDIAVPVGTKVSAAADGVVIRSKVEKGSDGRVKGYGEYIEIQHSDGSITTYAHLKEGSRLFNVGDHVDAGQVIGLSGNTGSSTGPHLHFGARNANGSLIVPLQNFVDFDHINPNNSDVITPEEFEALKDYYKDQLQPTQINDISDIVKDMMRNLNNAESQVLIRRTDPLTLDLNGNGQIDLIPLSQSRTFFDLDNDGFREQVGWVSPADGILALDANNNGVIDNIDELFGEQAANGTIVTGTEELRRDWDSNKDNKIDASDAGNIYNRLKIWKDLNSDGISQSNELSSLSANNIKSINLNTVTANQNIAGNVILSAGTFVKSDDTQGVLANLDLAINQTNSTSYTYNDASGNQVGNYNLNLETIFLPLSRGYGNAKAWHIAMSEDVNLLKQMKDLVNLTNGVNYSNLNQKIEEFIYSWTGTSGINSTLKRGEFSAKKLAALEAIRGSAYTDSTGSHDVMAWQLNMGETRAL